MKAALHETVRLGDVVTAVALRDDVRIVERPCAVRPRGLAASDEYILEVDYPRRKGVFVSSDKFLSVCGGVRQGVTQGGGPSFFGARDDNSGKLFVGEMGAFPAALLKRITCLFEGAANETLLASDVSVSVRQVAFGGSEGAVLGSQSLIAAEVGIR